MNKKESRKQSPLGKAAAEMNWEIGRIRACELVTINFANKHMPGYKNDLQRFFEDMKQAVRNKYWNQKEKLRQESRG